MVSCRTVDKNISSSSNKTEGSVFQELNIDNNLSSSTLNLEKEWQEKMMRELVSSLQLGFNGQSENDKLMVELQRTIDGLKFQVSGTGTVNYQENESINFETLKTELFKRQDSLFKKHLNGFLKSFKQSFKQSETKQKEVKVTGFQVGFYGVLTIGLITFIVGYYVSRFVRKHLV